MLCPHCGSKNLRSEGHLSEHFERLFCLHCGSTFVENTLLRYKTFEFTLTSTYPVKRSETTKEIQQKRLKDRWMNELSKHIEIGNKHTIESVVQFETNEDLTETITVKTVITYPAYQDL